MRQSPGLGAGLGLGEAASSGRFLISGRDFGSNSVCRRTNRVVMECATEAYSVDVEQGCAEKNRVWPVKSYFWPLHIALQEITLQSIILSNEGRPLGLFGGGWFLVRF
jgi:hypothetical protein